MPDLQTPLEEKIDALIEEHGFAAVRKAVDAWQADQWRARDDAPLPETVTLEQMTRNPHQSHGG